MSKNNGALWVRALALAAAWGVGEGLRGVLFTGFPWNLLGYVWSASEVSSQIFAVTGVGFMSMITIIIAALPAVGLLEARPARRFGCWFAAVILLAGGLGYGFVRLAIAVDPGVHDDLGLRLVQPNTPQHLKWKREHRRANFARLLTLSAQPAERRIDYVIWPESAPPLFLEQDVNARREIARSLPTGAQLITGAIRYAAEGNRISKLWNSIFLLDEDADIAQRYDKAHLVPFGEYLPLRPLLTKFGIDKLAAGAVDYVSGGEPALIESRGLPPFRGLVCYEVLFAAEVGRPSRPDWLLNLTNDAWFGNSSGPRQHLEIARARAIELGVPLVRVANTGISAVTDGYGREQGRIALSVRGVMDISLPRALKEAPFYVRFGELPKFLLIIFMTTVLLLGRSKLFEHMS